MITSHSLLTLSINLLPRGESILGCFRVEASLPQLGNQQVHNVLKGSRRGHVREVEPVQIGLADPPLHLIRDPGGVADAHGSEAPDRGLLGDDPRRPPGHVGTRRGEGVEHARDLVRLGRIGRRDVLVDRDFGNVDPRPSTEEDQAAYDRSVPLQLVVLLARFLVRPAHDGREGAKELDRAGIATLFRGQPSDLVDLWAQYLGGVRRHKDGLCVRGGKLASGGRRAGLEQERCALRRRVDDVSCVEVQVFAVMVNGPHLVRVDVRVVFGVRVQCVICP